MLPAMTSHTLFRHLEKEEILPVYYLYGDEIYLVVEVIRNIEKRVLSPDLKDFNYQIFYAGDDGAPKIINTVRTFPVMSQKRLVIVKEADQLSTRDLEEFIPYFSSPSSFACLVFIGEKVDSRKRFFKNLKKCGVIVQLNHPKEKDLPYWIPRLAGRFNKEINRDGVAFLTEIVGNNLQELYNEIEKVSIYAGEKRNIEIKDLEAVVTELKIENIFSLIDSVGNKDREKALSALQNILGSGENHLKVLGMIIYRFRLIFRAKEMLQKGLPPGEIGKKLGMRSFFLKKLLEQVNRFSLDELNGAFNQFFSTDSALKSSRVAKKIILEKLILDLCM